MVLGKPTANAADSALKGRAFPRGGSPRQAAGGGTAVRTGGWKARCVSAHGSIVRFENRAASFHRWWRSGPPRTSGPSLWDAHGSPLGVDTRNMGGSPLSRGDGMACSALHGTWWPSGQGWQLCKEATCSRKRQLLTLAPRPREPAPWGAF